MWRPAYSHVAPEIRSENSCGIETFSKLKKQASKKTFVDEQLYLSSFWISELILRGSYVGRQSLRRSTSRPPSMWPGSELHRMHYLQVRWWTEISAMRSELAQLAGPLIQEPLLIPSQKHRVFRPFCKGWCRGGNRNSWIIFNTYNKYLNN